MSSRGRQNVIFELGFFFGKLGRDRVAVLLGPGVGEPSDINGLVYIPVDEAGAWKYQLGRELQSAGIDAALDGFPRRLRPPIDPCGFGTATGRR